MKCMRTCLVLSSILVLIAGCGRHYYYYLDPSVEDGPEASEEADEPDDSDDGSAADDGGSPALAADVLSVSAPIEGAEYLPGDDLTIRWTSAKHVLFVRAELWRSGELLMVLAEETESDGEYTWEIPSEINDDFEAYNRYQVRLSVSDEPDEGYAASEWFTIGVEESIGGLSDVVVSTTGIVITVTDSGALVDGDTVDILLNGEAVISGHVLLGPPGTQIPLELSAVTNTLEIYAVNEGSTSPNTATLLISDVVSGEEEQEWHLLEGETGSLEVGVE